MSGMKPGALALVLFLVLLAHWGGLSWLGDQAQTGQPLVLMPDPLFMRMVLPQPVPQPRQRAPALTEPLAQQGETEATQVQAELPAPPDSVLAKSEPAPETVPAKVESVLAPAVPQVGPEPPAADVAPVDSWPADTRVSFQLRGYYRGDVSGSARVQWQREQSRYQVRLDLSLALVVQVSMISQGEATPGALIPSVYEERFLWGVQRLKFAGGYAYLPDGTQLAQAQPQALQDTASQFVELSHRFASGREVLQTGSEVRVWLARPQGSALWTYDVVGEETLQTPELGPVQAFHLRPRPIANPAGVINAEIWFAPSLQYLPVRVRIALGDNNFVDLMVERIEQGAPPANPAPEPKSP